MTMRETTRVYPWASPTQEQQAWFGALSPEEKRTAV
jgi:hypothetical protein